LRLVLFGLRHGLMPLLRLRRHGGGREPGSLPSPLSFEAMPTELSPLVEAINEYARRLDQYTGAQRVFIQNAAHQLRTPLTLMTTQVSYALRERTALDAKNRSQQSATRSSSQHGWSINLLHTVSGRGGTAPSPRSRSCHRRRDPQRARGTWPVRLKPRTSTWDSSRARARRWVAAPRLAVREIAMNLVDNAIRLYPARWHRNDAGSRARPMR
jgi:two-component system sensor histidine kinase TctE